MRQPTTTNNGDKKKFNRIDIKWDEDLFNDVKDMSELIGKSQKEVVQTAVRLYMLKEKKRLAKLAKMKAKLFPN